MPWAQLIILPLLIFIGLIFFLRYMLAKNISSAAAHIQELSGHYTAKEEEINRRLQEAKEECRNIVGRAKQEAEGLRDKLIKEANDDREQIIKEAVEKSEEMVQKAERTCELLKEELTRKADQSALDKACRLLEGALPDDFRRELHALWMRGLDKTDLKRGHLNLPDDIKEVAVTSAFPLERQEKEHLHDALKKTFGGDIGIKERVEPALIAGFTVTAGSIVVDASLKNKIHAVSKGQNPSNGK